MYGVLSLLGLEELIPLERLLLLMIEGDHTDIVAVFHAVFGRVLIEYMLVFAGERLEVHLHVEVVIEQRLFV